MSFEPVLIAGEWRQSQNPSRLFSAYDPSAKSPLSEKYPVSRIEDVEQALLSAQEAVTDLRTYAPEDIAHLLEIFADKIEARANDLSAPAT